MWRGVISNPERREYRLTLRERLAQQLMTIKQIANYCKPLAVPSTPLLSA
jgi:hypothetical protein